MSLTLRPLHETDLPDAWQLTQDLKWPHRLEDWRQALLLGEGVAAEEDGRLLGTALCWRWGDDYASLGLVIVADRAQGRGIGGQLMRALLDRLSGYNVHLHATPAGQGLYQKLGFVVTGAVRQHQCRELGAVAALPPGAGQRLRPATVADAERLTALDHQAHGQLRARLIAELLANGEQTLLLQNEETDDAIGFASMRRFGHGYAVGPIIARDLTDAKTLVSALLSQLPGRFVRIDSDPSLGLCDWLTAQGLPEVDAPTAMIRGSLWQPQPGGPRAFGLMTQALA